MVNRGLTLVNGTSQMEIKLMLKKLLVLAVFALQFLAISASTQAHDPIPECWPCPFVR